MKKILTIAFIILAGFATKSHAQGFKLGLGLEGALPLGSLKDYYNVGGGLTIRGAIGIDASSAVTITTGAIVFIPKDLSNIGLDTKAQLNIPLKAGYKYNVGGPVYVIGELGATMVRSYYSDANGDLQSVGSTHFTYAPGVGVNLGGFDASLRYEGYQGQSFMGLRLGFNF